MPSPRVAIEVEYRKRLERLPRDPDERDDQLYAAQQWYQQQLQSIGDTSPLVQGSALDKELNAYYGASGLQAPAGLMENQKQPGEVEGSDGAGNPIFINNTTGQTRPRGPIDQGTGKPFVPPKDATAAGKTPGGSTTGGTGTGGTTTTPPGKGDPAKGAGGSVLGITRGQYDDFSAMARSVMSNLGIVSREFTDAEIVQFALGGMNADGIKQFYSNLKEFVDQQPGLPYGMNKQQYEDTRTQMEKQTAAIDDTTPAGTGAATEPDYIKEALKEHMSASELQAGLADRNKRLGAKAPTATDVSSIRTRPTMTTEEDRAGAATTRTGLGPTQDLGGATAVSPFGRRR